MTSQPLPRHSEGFAPAPGADAVFAWVAGLADSVGVSAGERDVDAARIDHIRVLEDLKSLACAEQAKLTAAFDASQRRAQAEAGVPSARQGVGVAAQVALARRESPHRGQMLLGLANILDREMPHTRDRLADGTISEWTAICLARETACVDLDHRRAIDDELCADPVRIDSWGTRRLTTAARRLAEQLDPAACVKRANKARSERTVTIRPAPGAMTYLTALLPVAEGVACYAALTATAATANVIETDAVGRSARATAPTSSRSTARPSAEPRSRGQIMADTLVERVTGQQRASEVPVRVNLVISDQTLLASGNQGGRIQGGQAQGQDVPAHVARQLAKAASAAGRAQLRRLYASPTTGQLIALDSRSRIFPTALATFIDIRDQVCRTPYCDAPIRHRDHIQPHSEGGTTSASNGQGLCEACNYAKQGPGWRSRPARPSRGDPHTVHTVHTVTTETPTGHRYVSTAPALPAPMAATNQRGTTPDSPAPGGLLNQLTKNLLETAPDAKLTDVRSEGL